MLNIRAGALMTGIRFTHLLAAKLSQLSFIATLHRSSLVVYFRSLRENTSCQSSTCHGRSTRTKRNTTALLPSSLRTCQGSSSLILLRRCERLLPALKLTSKTCGYHRQLVLCILLLETAQLLFCSTRRVFQASFACAYARERGIFGLLLFLCDTSWRRGVAAEPASP